jgi:signal peptidase I
VSKDRRTPWARLGIVALNLIQPGLGLLRVGRPKFAAICLVAPWAAYALMLAYQAAAPALTFASYVATAALLVLVVLAAYIVAMVVSWRLSAVRGPEPRWWSRWYGIAAVAVVAIGLSWPLQGLGHFFYKPFRIPSESMAPTLVKGDRLLASMRPPAELRRGDVVIADVGASQYVSRIAALPGDRIEMRGGAVVLNGQTVPQRLLGVEQIAGYSGPVQGRRLAEKFPGEARTHAIYDLEASLVDDMPEQRVAPGHLFLLGDNRDRAADSRVSRVQSGIEQLPAAKVRGIVLFQTWNPDGSIGRPIR